MLVGKTYSVDCYVHDIEDCGISLQDPNIPPTEKCCDELKQHIDCICLYKQHYFKIDSGRLLHAVKENGALSHLHVVLRLVALAT
ncbi:unnamed protein product [Lactuca virosa]|uniref:Bifunctional inhibitor/plant lipid transfer protein/seed storage helical domain-containing protein n=1 Tax=Lactuca virosa TaxID=75947 RepID=A0AAU9LS93_9ASTR|nr:unnamed protein product [Lactuca virosa]